MPLALSLTIPGTRELFEYGVVALSAIFFVVDPIAVLPVFITITEGDSPEKREQMARRACLFTAGILLTFLVAGGLIFKLFSADAGGVSDCRRNPAVRDRV
jgi:small neutral amino acid transporter SnatA (MarC family)